MGLIAVNFRFDCDDDNGVDLRPYGSAWQEMDAFIGPEGSGKEPPSLISIAEDRIPRCAFTGKLYDPEMYGNEDNEAWPQTFNGQYLYLKIEAGLVTELRMISGEEYYSAD